MHISQINTEKLMQISTDKWYFVYFLNRVNLFENLDKAFEFIDKEYCYSNVYIRSGKPAYAGPKLLNALKDKQINQITSRLKMLFVQKQIKIESLIHGGKCCSAFSCKSCSGLGFKIDWNANAEKLAECVNNVIFSTSFPYLGDANVAISDTSINSDLYEATYTFSEYSLEEEINSYLVKLYSMNNLFFKQKNLICERLANDKIISFFSRGINER